MEEWGFDRQQRKLDVQMAGQDRIRGKKKKPARKHGKALDSAGVLAMRWVNINSGQVHRYVN